MARFPKAVLLGAASLVAALTLAGCGGENSAPSAGGGIKLIKPGRLTVCTHLPYPPFQFRQGDEVVGFDVDLMDLVAKDLGVRQEIVDTPFEGIKSGADLKTGKCDVAAAGMTITEERKQRLAFSDPYFDANQALLVRQGAPYKTLQDLDGKKVAVQSATTGRDYVLKNKPANLQPVEFEDLAALVSALETGKVDAVVNDYPVLYNWQKDHPGYAINAEFATGEQYGFAVKKTGNEALLKKIDEVLAKARQDGTYDRLYEKWFGKKPWATTAPTP